MVLTSSHEHFVFNKIFRDQGLAWRPFFDMDRKIQVVLENSKASDSMVDSIVENAPLRLGFANYHFISSTEAR